MLLINDEQAMHSIRVLRDAGYSATEVMKAMQALDKKASHPGCTCPLTNLCGGHWLCDGAKAERDKQCGTPSGFVALPEDAPPRFNGGIRCDMLVGTCACGAWHKENEGAMF